MNKKTIKFAGLALGMAMAIAGIGAAISASHGAVETKAAASSATINFGSATGRTNVNGASVTGKDSANVTWTVTTAGTTSFTSNAAYSQIGSSSKPASTITLTATLPTTYKVTNFSSSWGGFNGTAGSVTMKVGTTTVASGSLSGTSNVQVGQSTGSYSAGIDGTELTITLTGIAKGVKLYSVSYSYEASSDSLSAKESNYNLYIGKTLNLASCVNASGPNAGTLQFSISNGSDFGSLNGATLTGVAEGTITIKAEFSVGTVTPVYFNVVVSEQPAVPVWEPVTSRDDYTGLYLLVSDTNALDGSVELDKDNKTKQFSVEITKDGTIEGDYAAKAFKIVPYGNGYSLCSVEGHYFSGSSSGTFDASTSASEVAFNGSAMTSSSLTLRYNASYFRFYTSATQGDAVTFYKLDQSRSVASWINSKLDFEGTPDTEVNRGRSSDACKGDTGLYLEAKKALKAAESSALGTIADFKAGKATTFKAAYDRYTSWAEINNDAAPFDGKDSIVTTLHAAFAFNKIGGNNSALIIASVLVVGAISAGALVLLRRRKEN